MCRRKGKFSVVLIRSQSSMNLYPWDIKFTSISLSSLLTLSQTGWPEGLESGISLLQKLGISLSSGGRLE